MRRFIVSLLLFLSPALAFAHGDRPSFEAKAGPYLIDIGYDNIGFRPGEEVVLDFDLFTESGALAFAPFTTIDVTVTKDERTVLTEQLTNEPTHIPTFSLTFPQSGEYTLGVSYKQNGEELAFAVFPVSVQENNGAPGRIMNVANYVIAIVLVLVALYAILQSWRRRKSS